MGFYVICHLFQGNGALSQAKMQCSFAHLRAFAGELVRQNDSQLKRVQDPNFRHGPEKIGSRCAAGESKHPDYKPLPLGMGTEIANCKLLADILAESPKKSIRA